ncbi:hypothetical protein LguiB_012457 [Lonicera macranthoides]
MVKILSSAFGGNVFPVVSLKLLLLLLTQPADDILQLELMMLIQLLMHVILYFSGSEFGFKSGMIGRERIEKLLDSKPSIGGLLYVCIHTKSDEFAGTLIPFFKLRLRLCYNFPTVGGNVLGGWEFYVVQAELAMIEMWMELQFFQAELSMVERKS